MSNGTELESVELLDLRGLSASMIEMHILRLFEGNERRLRLDCLFDDDPNDALRALERRCSNWTFQRVEHAHWIIRNFTQNWVTLLRSWGPAPYGGNERRERHRP